MNHSHSKPRPSKQAEFQTTLSAKPSTRSRSLLHPKPKVSAFHASPCQHEPAPSTPHQTAVQNINHEYIQLYQSLFRGNKHLLHLFDLQVDRLYDHGAQMTAQQKEQYRCMALLKQVTENVRRVAEIRRARQKWKLIEEYLAGEGGAEQRATGLVNEYKQTQKMLKQSARQYELLVRNVQDLDSNTNSQQSLSEMQKIYKKTVKNLNKAAQKQKHYADKCQEEQDKLCHLQTTITRLNQTKVSIEMKLISERAKRDRLLRKRRDKQLRDSRNAAEGQKLRRSVSQVGRVQARVGCHTSRLEQSVTLSRF